MLRQSINRLPKHMFRSYAPVGQTRIGNHVAMVHKNPAFVKNYILNSSRSYVFFETKLGDFFRSLFNRERRHELYQSKQIIVKLRDTRKFIFNELHDRTSAKRKRIFLSSKQNYDHAKSKIIEWRKTKQSRIKLYYDNKRSVLKQNISRVSDKVKDRSMRMKNLAQIHGFYFRRPITIDEPMHPDWFTSDGYPLTSRNPHSGRFVNPWHSLTTSGLKSLADVWKWKSTRWHGFLQEEVKAFQEKKSIQTSIASKSLGHHSPFSPVSHKIKLTWIGHATCFIHMSNGFTVLTDPVFSKKPSPIPFFENIDFLGVPRLIPPSLNVEDFDTNSVDVCVISHDHYDHLDVKSIKELHYKDVVKIWAVPLGLKEWFHNCIDIEDDRVIELKWWQRATIQKENDGGVYWNSDVENVLSNNPDGNTKCELKDRLELTCVPAQHWGSRSPFDRNTRLWCSWGVKFVSEQAFSRDHSNTDLNFYFAGDTGYSKTFPLHRQIGDKLGPFDLSAIPIGAYKPRFFMKDSHCDPKEAVQIHTDIRSKRSVAIHWGTFPLANEHFDEPPAYLKNAVEEANLKADPLSNDIVDFVTISHGDCILSGSKENINRESQNLRML